MNVIQTIIRTGVKILIPGYIVRGKRKINLKDL